MNTCIINFTETKVGEKLRTLVGNNNVAYWNYVSKCFDDNGIKDSFKTWYEKTFRKECKTTDKDFAIRMIRYYNETATKVGRSLRSGVNISNVGKYNYPSIQDREEGIRHSVGFLLDEFTNIQNQGLTIKGNKREYYANVLQTQFKKHIFNYIAYLNKMSYDDVIADYQEATDKHKYLEKMFGGKNMTITGRNLLAVHDELTSSTESLNSYFNEVLGNKNLQSVLRQINDEKEEDDEDRKDQEEASDNEQDGNSESDTHMREDEGDNYIASANSHMGNYTSFMKHIGARITNYFNSLDKLSSPVRSGTEGNWTYTVDTNNNYGIPDKMDANKCSALLYSHARFNNIGEMIQSIEEIGNRMPEFYAFSKLAQDLRDDADFATEMRTVFAKTIMDKVETVLSDNEGSVRISNERANPRSSLMFDMLNDCRGSIIDIQPDLVNNNINKIIADISKGIKSIKFAQEHIQDLTKEDISKSNNEAAKYLATTIANVKSLIKAYFPSIQSEAIESYINNSNNANDTASKLDNCRNLINDIITLVSSAEKVQDNYYNIQDEIERGREHNRNIDSEIKKGNFVNTERVDISSLYSKDYLTDDSNAAVRRLMEKLLPYSIVNISLNSRNVYGNQSSDVINNSMVTNITKMLRLTYKDVNGNLVNETLSTWGRNKFRSHQYDYSGYLLETRDDEGNIIKAGLFKDKNGTLSDYAQNLINISLFNGTSNIDDDTNAMYTDQTKGDFLPTAFINFFKTPKEVEGVKTKQDNATYFLRTPSDAPKTFCIRAPRYDTKSFLTYEDDTNKINEIVNGYNKYNAENIPTDLFTPGIGVSGIKEDDLIKGLKNEGNLLITNAKSIHWIDKEKGIAAVNFAYKTNEEYYNNDTINQANGKRYIFVGTIDKSGKALYLKDYHFDGILGTVDTNLDGNLKEVLEGYYSKELKLHNIEINGKVYSKTNQIVNRNDKLFTRFRNEAKQELLDAAIALDYYFEMTPDGVIKTELVKGVRKPVFKKDRKNNIGYKFYHLGNNGTVLEEIKKGSKVIGYRLGGTVFGSNKFTLNVLDENGKIIHRNYVNEALFQEGEQEQSDNGKINVLYGGAVESNGAYVGTNLNIIRDANGNVSDVQLTDKQQETLDNALEEFILAYVNQAQERCEPYKDFIKGVEYNKDNINNFAINALLNHYNYDSIFEGSVLFYGTGQNVLKRAKEYQGSGVPYGTSNYFEDDAAPNTTVEHSYLNEGYYDVESTSFETVDGKRVKKTIKTPTKIQDIFKGTIFDGVKQTTKFRAITVANTKRTSDAAAQNGPLAKYLAKIYEAAHIDKDKALIMSNELMSGFGGTKVNDAQSYITIQEWVRRIAARGQLRKYMPLIQKLIKGDELSTADVKEFVQVQKNFYYDIHYDDKYKIEVPRQIKNAEFVLIPQFIKGTELEAVYNMMRAAKIDQLNTVETSKAANEEILTLWDNDGRLSGLLEDDGTINENGKFKQFVDKANEIATGNEYLYKYLYTQQETPQHVDAQNKFGIQIAKKIIDNIQVLSEDEKKTASADKVALSNLKERYMKLTAANVRDSFNNLMEELEVQLDDEGNIIVDEHDNINNINKKIFYDKLKEELLRTGADSNLMDYVTLENGEPRMKAITVDKITKFESVVQSVFNNRITRQKLPGFHAAQVTNMGFKKLGEVTGVNNVSYDKDLQYHPNNKGYIEVRLPYSAFGIDITKPFYKELRAKCANKAEFQDAILKDLRAKGLDIIIGYRIPTEGKQSVCNMKVVSFLDDAQGSTIVVPDDWVSQTGSDFDIDSVYGIQQKTRTTSTGEIKPIEFIEGQNVTIGDYANYLREFANNVDSDSEGTKLGNRKKAVREAINSIFDSSRVKVKGVFKEAISIKNEQQDAYNNASNSQNEAFENFRVNGPFAGKNLAMVINTIRNNQIVAAKKVEDNGGNKTEQYIAKLEATNNILQAIYKKVKLDINNSESAKLLIEANNELIKILKDNSVNNDNATSEQLAEIYSDRQKELEDIAKNNGLYSFDEFREAAINHPEDINSRDARTNEIFRCMRDILANPLSLEENLSRSNFDDITDALNDYMNPNVKDERVNRSAYNPFDQMSYQEEAMSGAKLKAFSVTLDTFCSVCNTVRPILSKPIYVVYDKSDYPDPTIIQKRFNDAKEKNLKSSKTFQVRHTTYGWSNDNRCAAGKILTSYSSQTTAYILDAIKSGAIPNVNDYTFAVFKTLANIGCDYKTSISYIMQPGVTEIVNAYNANHSVFSDYQGGNPINDAIKNIAKKMGYKVTNRTSVKELLKKIDEDYHKEFNKIFAQKGEEITISTNYDDIVNLPILVGKNVARLKGEGEFKNPPVGDITTNLFDLGVVLSFGKIYTSAKEIGDIARCCNPDKFGAKQDVYTTNKIFDDAVEMIQKHSEQEPDKPYNKPALIVNKNGKDIHILESIYPGLTNVSQDSNAHGIITENRITESSYPNLYSYLKYASATSTVVAKAVLPTQNLGFVNLLKGFIHKLNGWNVKLTSKAYKELQSYALGHFYNQCEFVQYPIDYSVDENGQMNVHLSENRTDGDFEAERQRIYGYNQNTSLTIRHTVEEDMYKKVDSKHTYITPEEYNELSSELKANYELTKVKAKDDVPFEVKDINNITNEEIKEFAKFSPAQKVAWIKKNFDDSGIFSKLQVSLYNPASRGYRVGSQTIEYIEDNANPNIAYQEFYNAFFDNNPLVAMTAYDLIKYAATVEGFKMSQRAITKIIDNKTLIGEFGTNGTGFQDAVLNRINDLDMANNPMTSNDADNKFYEEYLRSHPNTEGIKTYSVSKKNNEKYHLNNTYADIVTISIDKTLENESKEKAKDEFEERLEKVGFITRNSNDNTFKDNQYVRFKSKARGIEIYKIEKIDDNEYIAYPLNKLNPNEHGTWSANEDYNIHPRSETYQYIIGQYKADKENARLDKDYIKEQINDYRENEGNPYYNQRNKNYKIPALDFNLEQLASEDSGNAAAIIRQNIIKHFTSLDKYKPLRVKSLTLGRYIISTNSTSIQAISFPDGSKHTFAITKENTRKYDSVYLNDKKYTKEERLAAAYQIKDPLLRDSYIKAIEDNHVHVDNIFKIVENTDILQGDDASFAASVEESDLSALEYINLAQKGQREIKTGLDGETSLEVQATQQAKVQGIRLKYDNIKNNVDDATRIVAEYAIKKGQQLVTRFNQYIEDPENPDTYISLSDERIVDAIKDNPVAINNFFKTLNEISAYKARFITYKSCEISTDSPAVKKYVEDINEAYDKIASIDVDKANHNLMENYVSKFSTNPLIREGVLDISENYYKTYGSMWMFHDIMENGNPLLQNILKDVYSHIEAKRMTSLREVRDFKNNIKKIIDAAKKEGMTVDINKIIDSRGILIQDYSQEFLDKMEELRKAKNEAAKLGKGYGSIEYLTAKNKYDQYKAIYTHQAAKQDYYIQKANLERLMIKNHPRIYSRYMTLLYRQLDIYNYMTENGIPEEKQEELNRINDEMFNLRANTQYYIEDGISKERPSEDPDHDPTDYEYWSNPENDYEASSIYDVHEANALNDFLNKMHELNSMYFEYTPKYGFEDLLQKNLSIIRTLENPNANGVPTQSQEILESNPEYVAAKKWIKENAQYEIKAGKNEDGSFVNPLADKIIKALNRLKLGGNGKSRTVNSIMRHANNNEGIYDANKVPDGTKLTKDEIDSIRIEMENRYGIAGLPTGSDRVMISNAKPDGPLLNAAFYSRYGGGKKINTPEYIDVITQINKIHQKYWNPIDKTVNLQNIPDTKAGYEELKKLDELYQKLRQIRAANSESIDEETKKFREKYTKFKVNTELGREQAKGIVGKSDEFRKLYLNVVLEKKLDGTIKTDENGVAVPNRLLYGYLALKEDLSEDEKNRFIDKQRQEDLNLIDKSYKTVPTKYWEKALAEAHNRRDSDPSFDYNAWWNSNHVYNPYTREMELLPCWTTKAINPEYMEDGTFLGEWIPKAGMRTKKVKDGMTKLDGLDQKYYLEDQDMRDKDYKDDASLAANYIKGAGDGKYDNKVQLNDKEKELRDYIQNTLIKTAGNIVSRRYFESGRLPQRRKADPVNAKMVLKETGKLVGIGISTNNGKKDFDEYIGYDNDVTPIMPMLKDIVSSKVTKVIKPEELDAALKSDYTVTLDSKKFKKPERLNYETDDDYTKALAEYEATQELVKNHNEKVRKDNLDRNWIDVIGDYINQASRYNAIQDSKEKLYWLLEELRHQQAYIRKYGATGDLRLDNRRSTDDNNVYQTSTDDNLIKQYENQLRRLLWDQWKEPENHMTRWANQLQTFTSANYMMLNIRGGIANLTVGMQSIFGEAMAGDQFSGKGWRWGIAEWHKGLPGMAAGMYDEKAHGKVDGVIKLFKAVDYDEITGVVRNVGLAKWSERIRNAGFSPQTITENFMQNGVLLAMLHEHKIITIDGDDIRGIGARIMNKREYWNYKKINLLADILGEEQFNEYKKFKEEKMKDPNLLKDYAWFRKDLATDFVWQHCSPKQRAEYIKKQKEIKAKVEKEFDAKTDIYSQLEEKDGYIQFKQNSDLAKLDEFKSDKDGEDVTKAYALLGEFSEKVRKTNNYIHGVYNRQGMAYIEKTWYGSLVMQYHKHLPMGLMKRYHTRGNWNEVRNSVNKGMIPSCIDFLKLDIDLVKHDAGLSDDEVTALKGVQNILTHGYQLLTHLKTTWEIMPDYDKANIKRNLGDLIGVLGGITASIALIALGADDDKDKGAFENIMANLALYESDRLTSESFMYNPIGMQTELKTLMSTPIAAQSIITDGLKSIYEIGGFIMQGDSFDPIYKSGRFAGENKLSVYVQRRIPMWNGIRQVIDSPDNNHYYKVGDTACSLINTKGIGNWIGGRGYDYGKED